MTATTLLKNPLISRKLSGEEEQDLRDSVLTPNELLLLGCRTDSSVLTETAITRGAQVNHRDRESWTPLMHAAYHNSWKVIPILIRHRAIPHLRDDQGESPLDIAKHMKHQDTLQELNRQLEKSRLKQVGLFIQALTSLIREKQKKTELQNKTSMAWSYIDLGYGWWLSEQRMDKCFYYFRKAYSLSPRTGSFPYASLLASCGYMDEALELLFRIARRHWGGISRKEMKENQSFHVLHDDPRWKELLEIWPR